MLVNIMAEREKEADAKNRISVHECSFFWHISSHTGAEAENCRLIFVAEHVVLVKPCCILLKIKKREFSANLFNTKIYRRSIFIKRRPPERRRYCSCNELTGSFFSDNVSYCVNLYTAAVITKQTVYFRCQDVTFFFSSSNEKCCLFFHIL